MQSAKLLLNYLLAFLAITFVLQGCSPGDPGIWKNGEIKAGKRDDFHQLNESFFKSSKAGDLNDAQALMSQSLIEYNSNTSRLFEIIGNYLKDNDYSLFDEYYIIHEFKGPDTIQSGHVGADNYRLYYTSVTQEMYIASYLPKSGSHRWMITLVYGKFNYGWKLCNLDIDEYTKNGKTAPGLYKQALEQYQKGYLADAINTMALTVDCQRPNSMWVYPQENEWNVFHEKIMQEADNTYKFPIIIKQLPSEPKIFRISTQTLDDVTYPAIYYLSKVNIKDTTALKIENAAIKKVIGNIIPGIDKGKKYIFYSAFNEMPDAKKVPFFDMTDIHPSMP